jgi:hypothetical protein
VEDHACHAQLRAQDERESPYHCLNSFSKAIKLHDLTVIVVVVNVPSAWPTFLFDYQMLESPQVALYPFFSRSVHHQR